VRSHSRRAASEERNHPQDVLLDGKWKRALGHLQAIQQGAGKSDGCRPSLSLPGSRMTHTLLLPRGYSFEYTERALQSSSSRTAAVSSPRLSEEAGSQSVRMA
jgi:hypothetical protein